VYSSGGNGGPGGSGGQGGAGGAGSGGTGGPSAGLYRTGAGSSWSGGLTTLTQAGTAGPGGRVGTATLGAPSGNGLASGVLQSATAQTLASDFDGDAIVDTADNCPTIAAPGQPTGCPVRPAVLVDTDGDTVPNGSDRCPTVPVTGPDADEDGCTDVATPTPTATQTASPGPSPTQTPTSVPPAAVRSGIDADGDGFLAGQDCNDASSAIRPGAVEIRGNRIDENCDGTAEPFPLIPSNVASKWSVKGSTLTLTALQVTQAFPAGWKAEIRCTGKPKCAFKTKTLKGAKVVRGASSVIASLKKSQRRFRAGQTLEVWLSAPSFNTKVARLVLRKGKIPTTQSFCVAPGETVPQRTCT
jgi:hypothetical protein